jgi:hypothetical protein
MKTAFGGIFTIPELIGMFLIWMLFYFIVGTYFLYGLHILGVNFGQYKTGVEHSDRHI